MAEQPVLFDEGDLAPHAAPNIRRAFELYNEFAKQHKWAVATILDPGRQAALKRAMPYYGGVAGFQANLEKAARSDFLMGRVPGRNGQKAFKLDLDFLLQPKTMRRVIEDFYNGGGEGTTTASLAQQMKPQDRWSTFLRSYAGRRSMWPADLGPRPEDPACRAPAGILKVVRERLGIVVTEVKAETEEERLEAMIASYRGHGYWDRANAIEEKLSKLQGRPPVLVPAPDVARLGMPERADPAESGLTKPNLANSSKSKHRGPTRADAMSQRMAARMQDATPPQYADEPIGYDEWEEA
jgi:hypothetical protein